MDTAINFPHLGIHLDNVGKMFQVFGIDIAYYGVIVVTGMMLGMLVVLREARRVGENTDYYWDMLIIGLVAGVVGARIYYVVFAWDIYKDNLLEIFNTRHGGLAIYGGIIGAAVAVFIYSRIKKMSFTRIVDCIAPGLLLGQIIGRWGNFFNREAFGGYTDSLLAMQLPVSAVRENEITQQMWAHVQTVGGVDMIQVHPTFLYEGIWNLCILILLLIYRKKKKFDGEVFLLYLIGYGLGRVWIEGLRTDQLLIPGVGLPVSQVLSGILVVAAAAAILWKRKKMKKTASTLDVVDENKE
ncbi:prolipoprotein diacylglyceryl transferase [Ruminococcus sp. OA3]|uniref:prolipoprotein diacylglyceryl transferase n=1 Tax=Ruminococcus sp. OA3 TaxID=2914164 RepID=UPI001F054D32|nr:prolipoprotein diacylglyceryl transferase [Ruminococcus sp. OA3]MCH1982292.1 prolipoprotein diacylglyceryl transferase [Ruminococcus sp. OA3]